MELLTASGDEELHDAQGPYAVIAQVDNYVKDQGTRRRHLLCSGSCPLGQTIGMAKSDGRGMSRDSPLVGPEHDSSVKLAF